MGAAQPWLKFYPRDWRADEKLRLCSIGARGLWIEMLALMHGAGGRLLIAGQRPTLQQIAVQVGSSVDEIEPLIHELESAGVFSRDHKGVIYSRRMKSDEKKSEIARKNGKRGGNPKLCNKRGNSGSVKGANKGQDKLRSQKPDTLPEGNGADAPPDAEKLLFDAGVELLMDAGKSEGSARSIIGKWRKDTGDDDAVRLAIAECKAANISEPVSWIEGRFKARGEKRDPDDPDGKYWWLHVDRQAAGAGR